MSLSSTSKVVLLTEILLRITFWIVPLFTANIADTDVLLSPIFVPVADEDTFRLFILYPLPSKIPVNGLSASPIGAKALDSVISLPRINFPSRTSRTFSNPSAA